MKNVRLNSDYAACGLFLLSVLWCAVFPLISITTGELKPRGLYVDENALLARGGLPQPLPSYNIDESRRDMEHFQRASDFIKHISHSRGDFCSYFTSGLNSVYCRTLSKPFGNIREIIIDHPWKSRSLEITSVIIPYHSSNALQSYSFARALISKLLQSDWMSKRVLILLVPTNCQGVNSLEEVGDICDSVMHDGVADRIRYSSSLGVWLKDYHASNVDKESLFNIPIKSDIAAIRSGEHSAPLEGLLRDAYIVDFSEPFITSLQSEALKKVVRQPSVHSKTRPSWSKIQLSVVGNNGQLPNMDILSAPMATFADEVIDEGDTLPASTVRRESFSLPALLQSGLCGLASLFSHRHLCEKYCRVLSGLIQFSGVLIEGPSGLHGQFIRRNIDSLTLRPIAGSASPRSSQDEQDPSKANEDWATLDLVNLVAMVESCVRFSSNLHEELHHSQWFYLLMGSGLFVGLTEYASSMLLAMSPLFVLYFRLTHALPAPSLKRSTHSSEGSDVTPHWSLMDGMYMLLRDNSALWTLMAVQNLSGPRSPSPSPSSSTSFSTAAAVAGAVGAATLTMAAVDQYMHWLKSCKVAAAEGVQVQAADLSAYLSVTVISLILCLAWLAAQNIALAMVLAVHVVPATCVIAAAGYRLGLIRLYYKLSPPPPPVTVSVSVETLPTTPLKESGKDTTSSAAEKKEDSGDDIMTNKHHDKIVDYVTPNEIDTVILPASGDAPSLASVKGQGEDIVLDSDSDKKREAMTLEGESSTSSSPVRGLISAVPSQAVKTQCRCALLLLLLLCSPAVVPAIVFRYKTMFLSHSHAHTLTSATYFASLANDWAHTEIASLAYPSLLLLPHMLSVVCMRLFILAAYP